MTMRVDNTCMNSPGFIRYEENEVWPQNLGFIILLIDNAKRLWLWCRRIPIPSDSVCRVHLGVKNLTLPTIQQVGILAILIGQEMSLE